MRLLKKSKLTYVICFFILSIFVLSPFMVFAKLNNKGVTCNTTRAQVLAGDALRTTVGIKATSTNTVQVFIGNSTVTADENTSTSGLPLAANATMTLNNSALSSEASDAIYCITASGSGTLTLVYTTRR